MQMRRKCIGFGVTPDMQAFIIALLATTVPMVTCISDGPSG
jgi:hypothetical protein